MCVMLCVTHLEVGDERVCEQRQTRKVHDSETKSEIACNDMYDSP